MLFKKLLGLVEMTSELVNASFSLPEWEAVKMFFLHPGNCWQTPNLSQTLGLKKTASQLTMSSQNSN